jgi:hypothetical protein
MKFLLIVSLIVSAPIAVIAWLINAIIYILFRWIPGIGIYVSMPFQTVSLLLSSPFMITLYRLGWIKGRTNFSDRVYETDRLRTYKVMLKSGDAELILNAKEGLLSMAQNGNVRACKELLKQQPTGTKDKPCRKEGD